MKEYALLLDGRCVCSSTSKGALWDFACALVKELQRARILRPGLFRRPLEFATAQGVKLQFHVRSGLGRWTLVQDWVDPPKKPRGISVGRERKTLETPRWLHKWIAQRSGSPPAAAARAQTPLAQSSLAAATARAPATHPQSAPALATASAPPDPAQSAPVAAYPTAKSTASLDLTHACASRPAAPAARGSLAPRSATVSGQTHPEPAVRPSLPRKRQSKLSGVAKRLRCSSVACPARTVVDARICDVESSRRLRLACWLRGARRLLSEEDYTRFKTIMHRLRVARASGHLDGCAADLRLLADLLARAIPADRQITSAHANWMLALEEGLPPSLRAVWRSMLGVCSGVHGEPSPVVAPAFCQRKRVTVRSPGIANLAKTMLASVASSTPHRKERAWLLERSRAFLTRTVDSTERAVQRNEGRDIIDGNVVEEHEMTWDWQTYVYHPSPPLKRLIGAVMQQSCTFNFGFGEAWDAKAVTKLCCLDRVSLFSMMRTHSLQWPLTFARLRWILVICW